VGLPESTMQWVFHSAEKMIKTNFLSLFKLIFSSGMWLKWHPGVFCLRKEEKTFEN
jgi:hypothetical protein